MPAAIVIVTVAVWLVVRPPPTLVSSGVLAERDKLVLADFANRTADSTLGASITEALRVDLTQSPTVRLTDGNAFFVTEVLASGGRLPATVQEAVLARVAQLTAAARRVVEGVSVAPRSLEVAHAAAIADASADDVDTALSAGVLVGEGHHLRFRHDLARAAIEEALPPARRLGLHLRMIDILEDSTTPDLARIAHHAIRAGRADLVVRHAPPAGDEAARAGARREAVAFYRAALAHSMEMPPD